MDYEKEELKKYETLWQSMKGAFSDDSWHFTSNTPYPAVTWAITQLRKRGMTLGSVLDVGCGNGRHSIVLAQSGFAVTGIDIAPSAIALAKKNADRHNLSIDNKVGSILTHKFPAKNFDLIVDANCFSHLRLSQRRRYAKRVAELIQDQGYFLLICFSDKSGYIPSFRPAHRNWYQHNGHYNHFITETEISDMFSKHFHIIDQYHMPKPGSPLVFTVTLFQKKY